MITQLKDGEFYVFSIYSGDPREEHRIAQQGSSFGILIYKGTAEKFEVKGADWQSHVKCWKVRKATRLEKQWLQLSSYFGKVVDKPKKEYPFELDVLPYRVICSTLEETNAVLEIYYSKGYSFVGGRDKITIRGSCLRPGIRGEEPTGEIFHSCPLANTKDISAKDFIEKFGLTNSTGIKSSIEKIAELARPNSNLIYELNKAQKKINNLTKEINILEDIVATDFDELSDYFNLKLAAKSGKVIIDGVEFTAKKSLVKRIWTKLVG